MQKGTRLTIGSFLPEIGRFLFAILRSLPVANQRTSAAFSNPLRSGRLCYPLRLLGLARSGRLVFGDLRKRPVGCVGPKKRTGLSAGRVRDQRIPPSGTPTHGSLPEQLLHSEKSTKTHPSDQVEESLQPIVLPVTDFSLWMRVSHRKSRLAMRPSHRDELPRSG